MLILDEIPNLQDLANQRFTRSKSPMIGHRAVSALRDRDYELSTNNRSVSPAPTNKTKEELAEIRKALMKSKFKDRADPYNPLSARKMEPDVRI